MSTDNKRFISKEHQLYLKGIQKNKLIITLSRWLILILIIILWETAANLKWIDPFIISSPSRIIKTIRNLYIEGVLFNHIGVTLLETIIGFSAGTVIGIIIAVLLWWSETASKILEPYLVVLNSLPKVALGPILIVWIGAGKMAIITMALLISIVVTIMNVLAGFLEVDKEKIKLLKTFGATKFQVLQKVVLPASIPTIISTLKINVGMSWVGVIVGEYLVSKEGLGYLIVYGGQVFQLDLVMSSVIILSVAAALMYQGVALLEKRFMR